MLTFYEDEMIVFTDKQKARIQKGQKDVAEARFISNEEADKEIEEWLFSSDGQEIIENENSDFSVKNSENSVVKN